MWQVGDTATHAAFLATLARGGHVYESYVDLWLEGSKVGQLSTGAEIGSGTVRVTARNRERRSLEMAVKESLWPVGDTDLLAPYGVWATVRVRITAGAAVFPDVPVFAGKVLSVTRDRWEGQVVVSAVDPMWQVNKEAIELPRPAPSGTRVVTGIQILIGEVFAGAAVADLTGDTSLIPAATLWNAGSGSRGRAIDDLAGSIGAEVFALPTVPSPGGQFVIRRVPSLDDQIAWVLPDGDLSVVVADQLVKTGAGVVNRWVVTVERPDSPSLYVAVTDEDPLSVTRYAGPIGRLPDFASSPLITTEGQAINAGKAKLARSKGLARTRKVTVVANPAVEAGDVLFIGVDGEPAETHIVDGFELPLTHAQPAMTIDTRSTVASE